MRGGVTTVIPFVIVMRKSDIAVSLVMMRKLLTLLVFVIYVSEAVFTRAMHGIGVVE